MSEAIQGLAELQQKLAYLGGKGASKMIRSAVGAGMTSLRSSLVAAVNASGAPHDVKRAARKWIGKRYAKGGMNRMGKTTQSVAKVGFGVGFNMNRIRKAAERHAASGRSGVGLSAANVHWFVLGTEERATKRGHPTGAIAPFLFGSVRMATQYGGPQALEAARRKVTELLSQEAQKKG